MPPRGATATTDHCGAIAAVSPAALSALVEHRGRFLGFLERRLGRRDVAEEILQETFVRGIERGGELRADESAVAWFYRALRNALVDHHRRAAAEARGLAAFHDEPRSADDGALDAELVAAIRACVRGVVETLKPEYAEAIQRVDLGGAPVRAFADAAGLSTTNAGVRLHRARRALRRGLLEACGACAEHQCYECACRAEPHAAATTP